LEWTDIRMLYFTHGIEVDNFRDLDIRNYKGSGSSINAKAFLILLKSGSQVNIDSKIGVMKLNVK